MGLRRISFFFFFVWGSFHPQLRFYADTRPLISENTAPTYVTCALPTIAEYCAVAQRWLTESDGAATFGNSWVYQLLPSAYPTPALLAGCLASKDGQFVLVDNSGSIGLLATDIEAADVGHIWAFANPRLLIERVNAANNIGNATTPLCATIVSAFPWHAQLCRS